ncbi:MAG: glycosyltransferase [Burkholderiaceae bacterium]
MKSIALTMIARNEERCIERCLNSARDWVDQMIVLDTGSTDRTIALARACGAEVHERRWTDDFAAARNAVLARSRCDYNLVIDADEWIESGGESLMTVRRSEQPSVYVVRVRSELGAAHLSLDSFSDLSRVLPRGVRYRGRVHEQPHHSLPMMRIDLQLGHDGYLKSNLQEKQGRNRELLLRNLAEEPDNPYTLYQIGKDDDAYGDYPSALDYFFRARELTPSGASWRHDLVMRSMACMLCNDDIDKAMLLAADEMANWAHSPDYHFLTGEILFARFRSRPDQGRDLLPMIELSYRKALELGDSDTLSGTVKGRGSFLAADRLWAFHQAQGHIEQAQYFDALRQAMRENRQSEATTSS